MVLVGDCLSAGAGQGPRRHVRAAVRRSAVGQRLSEVWRMRTREERDASLALAVRARQPAAHRGGLVSRCMTACTPVTRSRWPPTRCRPISTARAGGKDAAIICDTWDIADAINLRLHDTLHRGRGPSVRVARDQRGAGRGPDREPPQRRHRRRAARPEAPAATRRIRSATATGGGWPASTPNPGPHRCRTPHRQGPRGVRSATTSASTSPWVTRPRCIPRRASPPTLLGVCLAILSERAHPGDGLRRDDPRPAQQ